MNKWVGVFYILVYAFFSDVAWAVTELKASPGTTSVSITWVRDPVYTHTEITEPKLGVVCDTTASSCTKSGLETATRYDLTARSYRIVSSNGVSVKDYQSEEVPEAFLTRLGGTLTESRTLGPSPGPGEYISGSLTIPSGVTLTLNGAELHIVSTTSSNPVDFNVQGSLVSTGSTFTTNQAVVKKGQWGQIKFWPGSTGNFNGTTIEGNGRDNWGGIYANQASISFVNSSISMVGDGEGSGPGAIRVDNGSLSIRGTSFSDVDGVGIRLNNSTATIEGNSFEYTHTPISASSFPEFPLIKDNTYSNNTNDGTTFGKITSSGTIYDPVIGGLNIDTDVTLTITAGNSIKMSRGTAGPNNGPGITVRGNLILNGTEGQPVLITSKEEVKAPGQWGYIEFLPGSSGDINHTIIEAAGTNQLSNRWGVNIEEAEVSIDNSEIRLIGNSNSDTRTSDAIRVRSNGSLTISNSVIEDVDGQGIDLQGSSASIENNVFRNTNIPINVGSFTHFPLIRDNTFTNNRRADATSFGSINASGTWFDPVLSGGGSIATDVTLTIAPGNSVMFTQPFPNSEAAKLTVNGRIIAQGTKDKPIVLTSDKEEKAQGQWGFIDFQPGSSGAFRHAIIEGAGTNMTRDRWGINIEGAEVTIDSSEIRLIGNSNDNSHERTSDAIRVRSNGKLSVTNTSIHDVDGDGIDWQGDSNSLPSISDNNFESIEGYAVRGSSSQVIDASNNWWGDQDGPNDASDDTGTGGWYNPNPQGQSVSNYVLYEPWSETPEGNVRVTVTSPNVGGETYRPGDVVTIQWTAVNAQPTDTMVLAFKRDAAAGDLEPDDVNWYRFTSNTPNDGSEEVTIPANLAPADDWHFFVRHEASNVYDASDATFTYEIPVDAVKPVVEITQPTSETTYSITSPTIDLAGTATDDTGVISVTWKNETTEATGSITGTDSWAASSIPLQAGNNVIQIIAVDAAGNQGLDTIIVERIIPPDTVKPKVQITQPTDGISYTTEDPTITLAGTSEDEGGVVSITWENVSTGETGSASGTDNWTANDIPLRGGGNVIQITAKDAAGNEGKDTITVTRPDNTDPTVTITQPTDAISHTTNSATITLGGNAEDNIEVTSVTWENVSTGETGNATGTDHWSALNIPLRVGANVIQITAHDEVGRDGKDTITITRTDETDPEVSSASMDKTSYAEGDSATVTWTASDEDGIDHIGLYLIVPGKDEYTIQSSISNTPNSHTFNIPSGYVSNGAKIKVVAFDPTGNTGFTFTDSFSIAAGNQAPVADAGDDQTVEVGSVVTLDGSGSSDPDGDSITYTWVQTNGAGVSLSDGNAINPTFTAPDDAGELEFRLTVDDAAGLVNSAVVVIAVKTKEKVRLELIADPTVGGTVMAYFKESEEWAGLTCNGFPDQTCVGEFNTGTKIQLLAIPNVVEQFGFNAWSNCVPSNLEKPQVCELTLIEDLKVSATFTLQRPVVDGIEFNLSEDYGKQNTFLSVEHICKSHHQNTAISVVESILTIKNDQGEEVEPTFPTYYPHAGIYTVECVAEDENGIRSAPFVKVFDIRDSDGDALPDIWESAGGGIDVNGDGVPELDLYALGGRPDRKDIFVELDYMQEYSPTPEGMRNRLQSVVQAYHLASTPDIDGVESGINLHVDIDEEVPSVLRIYFRSDVAGNGVNDFNDLKIGSPGGSECGSDLGHGYFGSSLTRNSDDCELILRARKLSFKYAIVGGKFLECEGCSGTGEGHARNPGNDFFIAMRGFKQETLEKPNFNDYFESTFMHELGHQQGLGHGGGDNLNCKPNYLSVMNYYYQLKDIVPDRPLDYSSQEFDALKEFGLSEIDGLRDGSGAVGSSNWWVVFGVGQTGELNYEISSLSLELDTRVTADMPINWNNANGLENELVEGNINYFATKPACADKESNDEILFGYNDWHSLEYNFRKNSETFSDGTSRSSYFSPEEQTMDNVVNAAKSLDFDGDGLSNYDDNCAAVFNPDQIDVDSDGVGDICASSTRGDTDGDGVLNEVDNCPVHKNTSQEDRNDNGVGDVCEGIEINNPPSFLKGEDLAVQVGFRNQVVKQWATNIDDGDNGSQSLRFEIVSVTNNDIFTALPMVDADTGNLSYSIKEGVTGSSRITLVLIDDGGTLYGGIDTSVMSSFNITVVMPVNNMPSFIAGSDQSSNEDAERVEVPAWATAVEDGDGGTQSLHFKVIGNSNLGLFEEQPWVSYPSRTLRYKARPNTFGEAIIELVLKDNGGTASGGVDTSAAQQFKITVLPVNDVPSITGSPSVRVNEGEGYYFKPEAFDADGDTHEFEIVNKPSWAHFDSKTGSLSGAPNGNHVGRYDYIQISVSDGNGGSASLPTFTITVGNINEAPLISGNPTGSVDQGAFFYFAPHANDPDGDRLTFSVANKPAWLSFNSHSGALQGTPGAGDVGQFNYIRVSVSDGQGGQAALVFSLRVLAKADVKLSLQAETQILEIDKAANVTAVIHNDGAAVAENVSLDLRLEGQSFLDIIDPRCAIQEQIHCVIGDLPPGTTEVEFRFSRDTAGDLFVLAEMSAGNDVADYDNVSNLGLVVGEDASVTPGIELTKGASRAVAVGDLNGDGRDDIVLANEAGNPTQVLIAGENSRFVPSNSLNDESSNSYDVSVADLDKDGDLDIVLANALNAPTDHVKDDAPGGQANTVWLNSGLGEFELAQSLGREDSYGVSVGDADNDGDVDLIFANRSNNTLYLNDGTGHFELDANRKLGEGNSQAVALADVNQDGALDAVFANIRGNNALYLSLSDELIVIPDGADSYDVAIADLDNDGVLEMVFANSGTGSTDPANTIYRYNQDDSSVEKQATLGKQQSRDVLVLDADGDGKQDLLFINEHGGHQLYPGADAIDGFIQHGDLIVMPGGEQAAGMQINEDALYDLVIASRLEDSASMGFINQDGRSYRSRVLADSAKATGKIEGAGVLGFWALLGLMSLFFIRLFVLRQALLVRQAQDKP